MKSLKEIIEDKLKDEERKRDYIKDFYKWFIKPENYEHHLEWSFYIANIIKSINKWVKYYKSKLKLIEKWKEQSINDKSK